MSDKYVIGIDSGTQSTRVIIFDSEGNRVCKGSAAHPEMISERQGWHEHGVDDLWNALCTAARDAMSQFSDDPAKIIGIGVSSQRYALNMVDENGTPLHRPISWMDGRWKMNYASLGQMPDDIEDPAYKYFLPYYSRPNWLKVNQPELYKRVAKYLNVSGYLGFKLTGQYVDTISNNLAMPFDLKNWKVYDTDREFELLGMRRDQLADIGLPGTIVGNVTAEAAKETGFPEGCPAVTCAGDKQCELLGAGAVKHGQAYITLGTLSGLDIVSKDYTPSPAIKYQTYLAAFPKMYNYEASVSKGFWLVSWFRDNLGVDLEDIAKELGTSPEALLDKEAEKIPAGAEGLVVLPDWSPGGGRTYGKGMFIGFDDRHKRGHMFRALIEGIVFQLKIGTEDMAKAVGIPLTSLYIGGGGSKSDFTSQVIADMFNVPVYRAKESENCSLGAAMCAAVGTGIYADFAGAVEGMAKNYDTFHPVAENVEIYNQLSEKVIQKLYPCLEDVMKDLTELTADKR